MNSEKEVWDEVLRIISKDITPTAIKTWFSDTVPVDICDLKFIIATPNEFKKNIIMNRFGGIIRETLSELFSADFDLVILTGDEIEDYREKKISENTLPEMEGYTFDSFIVGKSNEFAHAAAIAVSKNPGNPTYNPLFIYGNSGLGKTHLLYSIGHSIQMNNPKATIAYIKGDEFTNQMINAIRNNTNEEFRQKYRNVDLFLVDDIQFIAGKDQTQNEFFHTFNNLYESKHQIVITSDRPPMDMPTLDDRLKTRFEGGMMADIKAPDFETRMAIIKNKAAQLGLILPEDCVEHIAKKLTANIRQIEGVVKKLFAYNDILNGAISIELVNKAIETVIRDGEFIPTPDVIIRETARYFNVSVDEVKGQSKSKNITMARHVSMYLMRTLISLQLEEIGSNFNNRNHSTVIASIRKIEELLKTDKEMTSTIRDITSNINSVN